MKELLSYIQMFVLGCLGSCLGSFVLWNARQLTISQEQNISKVSGCSTVKAKILSPCFVLKILCFIFFVVFYKAFGVSRELFIVSLTFFVLLFHAYTDYLAGITFDLVTYIFVPCILLLRMCFGVDFFLQGLYLMLVALGAMFLIFLVSRGKSGVGDVFVASCLGCGCFSIVGCAVCLYLAFLFGAVTGVSLLVMKKITKQTRIPFAPFLLLGYAMGIVLIGLF